MSTKQVGLIGLGSMGKNIAERLHDSGYSLVLYNRTESRYAPFRNMESVYLSTDVQDFANRIGSASKGNIVWVMVPGGFVTNNLMHGLSALLRKNNIVIDASNSIYTDSIANYNVLKAKGISYLDVGCAGGPEDVLKGVSLMVGGDRLAFERAEEILKVISGNGAYGYLGDSGSGHMVKLIHNLIFYGLFPIYAEGTELLLKMNAEKPDGSFNIEEALRLMKLSPPITTDIMEAISTAIVKGQIPSTAPQPKLSDMVKFGEREAEKLGVSFSVTKAIFAAYDLMSEESRKIYAAAKLIITGH